MEASGKSSDDGLSLMDDIVNTIMHTETDVNFYNMQEDVLTCGDIRGGIVHDIPSVYEVSQLEKCACIHC